MRLKRAGLAIVAIAVVLAMAAWIATIVLRPHGPSPASITRAMIAQSALRGGAQVYATHCAYCHDTGFGPAIAGMNLAPATLATIVRSGPGMMPAFPASQVSDSDLVALAHYVNTLRVRPAGAK